MFGFIKKKIPVSLLAEEAVEGWDLIARRSTIFEVWPADSAFDQALFDVEHLALELFGHVIVLEDLGLKKERIEEFIARFVELGATKLTAQAGGSSKTLDPAQLVEFSLTRLNRYLTRKQQSGDWFSKVGADFAQNLGTIDYRVKTVIGVMVAQEYKHRYDFMKDFLSKFPVA